MRNTFLLSVCIAVVLVLGVPSCSLCSDDDEQPLEPSVTLGPCVGDLQVGPKMNATGRALRDSRFVQQDLRGAVFDRCDLTSVWFVECNLSAASFKGAWFTDAGISACNIAGADFDDARVNGLETFGAHLSVKQFQSTHSFRTRDLMDCTFKGSDLESQMIPILKYDFSHARLGRAHLLSGDFRQCDFTDAHIGGMRTETCMPGIELARARITSAQLASTASYKRHQLLNMTFSVFGSHGLPGGGSIIEGPVDLRGMDLTGIKIYGLALPGAEFTDATVTEGVFYAGISHAQLCSTKNYKEGDLSRMHFENMDFSAFDFSRQNLTGTVFRECTLTGAYFRDAIITNMDFTLSSINNRGLTVKQIQSTWNYKNGRMAGVVLPEKIAEALRKEKDSEKQK